jgi:hypothetical protein
MAGEFLARPSLCHRGGRGRFHTACLARRAAARSAVPLSPFVAVPNLLAAGPPAPAYRLQWPGGLSLEVRAGFAVGELAALLQMLPAL